jgi:DNA repair exonuclease SbcCD ATPase subunit
MLPLEAQAKLDELTQSAADSDALLRSTPKRIEDLGRQIIQLAQRRSTFDEQDERYETLRLEIAAAQQRQEHLREVATRRRERATNDRDTLKAISVWAHMLPVGTHLVSVETPLPNVTDLAAAITSTRDEIGSLKQQIREMKGKHLPKDELRQKAVAYVKQMAAEAKPVLQGVARDQRFALELSSRVPLHVLSALAPDLVVDGLHRLISEQVPDDTLPADERKARVAELEALLLSCERSEEALVVEARSRGMDILRRPRADIRAILGVEVVEKAAAKPKKAAAMPKKAKQTEPLAMAG